MASTKDKKLALARQLLALNELNDELDEVRRQAQAGREYLWAVFADAYIWYQNAQGVIGMSGQPYLEQTFLSHTPKITSKTGVSEFNRLAKLAFNMNLNRFAPTVSRYTAAFDYIDRAMKTRAKKDPKKIKEFIRKAGGIHGCAHEQKKWLEKKNKPKLRAAKKKAQDLFNACVAAFKKKKTIGDVKARDVTPSHGFVLLIAKPKKKAGDYSIIDVLEDVSDDEMEALLTRNS